MPTVSSHGDSLRIMVEHDNSEGHRVRRALIERFDLDPEKAKTLFVDAIMRVVVAINEEKGG